MNYTIISFAAANKDIVNKYKNDNIKYISFLDDLKELIDKHKNEIDSDLLKDSKFRYLNNCDTINDIINIDELLEKYINENENIVVIHSLGISYDEQMAMRLCQLIKENNKDSISIFAIPFAFIGNVKLYKSYLDYLPNLSKKIYSFDCCDLREKISGTTSLFECFNYVYSIMFYIAYNIENDINITDIIYKILNNQL